MITLVFCVDPVLSYKFTFPTPSFTFMLHRFRHSQFPSLPESCWLKLVVHYTVNFRLELFLTEIPLFYFHGQPNLLKWQKWLKIFDLLQNIKMYHFRKKHEIGKKLYGNTNVNNSGTIANEERSWGSCQIWNIENKFQLVRKNFFTKIQACF